MIIALEAAFAAGIALSCTLSGAALVHSLYTKRAAVAKARRVANATVEEAAGYRLNGFAVRLANLESDEKTVNFALNRAGILKGRLLPPEPDVIRLHREPPAEAGGAA